MIVKLVLALFALFSANAFADGDQAQEIISLVSRGKGEYRACNKFKKKWKNVVKGGLTIDSASHVSREQAQEALKLLEKNPGTAPSFAKARHLIIENHEELEKIPEQVRLLEKLGGIEGECETFSQMIHLSMLFKDIKVLSLNKKETARVRHLAKKVLGADLPLLSLVAGGVKGKVLENYLSFAYENEGRDPLLARVKAYQADLELKRSQVIEAQKKINLTDRRDTLTSFAPEYDATKELSKSFEAIYQDLKF